MGYLCQECKSNNNGWCTVRKCNGLKKLNITNCDTYEDKNIVKFTNGNKIEQIKGEWIAKGNRSKIIEFIGNEEVFDDNSEAYRTLGKRQMLWNIQMQVVAINKDVPKEERYDALVECLKSFAKMQEFEESLYNVDKIIDSVIDSDMIEQSKYINKII